MTPDVKKQYLWVILLVCINTYYCTCTRRLHEEHFELLIAWLFSISLVVVVCFIFFKPFYLYFSIHIYAKETFIQD